MKNIIIILLLIGSVTFIQAQEASSTPYHLNMKKNAVYGTGSLFVIGTGFHTNYERKILVSGRGEAIAISGGFGGRAQLYQSGWTDVYVIPLIPLPTLGISDKTSFNTNLHLMSGRNNHFMEVSTGLIYPSAQGLSLNGHIGYRYENEDGVLVRVGVGSSLYFGVGVVF